MDWMKYSRPGRHPTASLTSRLQLRAHVTRSRDSAPASRPPGARSHLLNLRRRWRFRLPRGKCQCPLSHLSRGVLFAATARRVDGREDPVSATLTFWIRFRAILPLLVPHRPCGAA